VAGLDHPDVKDYSSGQTAVFDGEPDQGETDGITNCYRVDLGGTVTGGAVTWQGTGMFSPQNREVCIQLTVQDSPWCCKMEAAYSTQGVKVEFTTCTQTEK